MIFDTSSQPLTPISQLGEFGCIHRIAQGFSSYGNVIKGIGDDAAVIRIGNGEVQLVSTDLLVEGIHFDLSYVPLHLLGFKSIAVNVSDICAMNGTAEAVTVSVALSSRFTVEALDALYDGIATACKAYGVQLVGGDTTSSRSGLMISVTVLGRAREEDVVYRSGAREQDLICISGDIGAAYAGLQVLEREKQVFLSNPEMQPELGEYVYVVGRQLKPAARTDTVQALAEVGIKPSAMIDLSDGLAGDLGHLCTESKLGALIYEDKLPLDYQTEQVAEQFGAQPETYAMHGGEDYELLMTIPVADFKKVQSIPGLHIIGHMTPYEEGRKMVLRSGNVADITFSGFTHF